WRCSACRDRVRARQARDEAPRPRPDSLQARQRQRLRVTFSWIPFPSRWAGKAAPYVGFAKHRVSSAASVGISVKYKFGPGARLIASGSSAPTRTPVSSTTVFTSPTLNCGSAKAHTAPDVLILLRNSMSRLALGGISGLIEIEPIAESPNRR